MKKVTFLLIIGTLLLSACGIKVPGIVTGSGKMLTKTFNVHDFDQIRLSTSGMLYIQQGNTFNLTVETDDNILPLLYVEEEQGVLTIRTRPITILQFETIIYHVTQPDLRAIDLSGSAEVRVEDFQSDSLHINLSGSGDVTFMNLVTEALTTRISGSGNVMVENLIAETVRTEVNDSSEVHLIGAADSHEINVSGSGEVLTDNLQVSDAQVTVNGSGDVTVWAVDHLNVDISGSGNVQYFGSPDLTKTISGAGELVSLGSK